MASQFRSDWKSQKRWVKTGYGLTALWFLYVMYETKGEQSHALFDAIFLVPLGGWIAAVLIARFLGAGDRAGGDGGAPPEGRE
jgi:hypothetical protein